MKGIRVLPADLITAGLCMSGGRRWFHMYDLDFNTFLKEGIPVDDLREKAPGDPLAERAIETAVARVTKPEGDSDGR